MMLQAAEISKGRTVSQLMAYCHPQAKPQDGSMNRQMYMVKAPLIGYMTASSANACIIKYIIMPMRVNPMITAAGPPVTKDEAEPMNRPEPMAPPL
jgi:hypothetical protein